MGAMATSRVIALTPGLAGSDGIAEVSRQYVALLADAMRDMGGRLEVWSLTDGDRPDGLDPAIDFRGAAGRRLRFASWGLSAGAVDHRTLVVGLHVHLLAVALPLVWQGARLASVMYGIEVWKPLRRLERAALQRAWRRIAISHHTVARFHATHPDLAEAAVRVCHPAVPSAAPAGARMFDGPYALIVGRMAAAERYKGHDALLAIWPRVRASVPDARLVIAGDGDDRDRLEAVARAAGLAGSVVFTGRVDAATLAALYRDATAFVMPSAGEGLGLVYLEAMAAGTPCVARPGAPEEIITHGVNGVIVDPETDGGSRLAAAIIHLLTDAHWRARLATEAMATIRERFSPEQTRACVRQALGLDEVGRLC